MISNEFSRSSEFSLGSHADSENKHGRCITIRSVKMRYIVVLLNFLGVLFSTSLRAILSVAILAMVKHPVKKESNKVGDCLPFNETTNQTEVSADQGEFNWDMSQQTTILGAFFWGYIITQVPGGILAQKYGAHLFVGAGMFSSAVGTLLMPISANAGYSVLITVRIITGIGEGVMFPAIHSLLSKWAPPLERSRMVSASYAGTYAGTIIAGSVTGVLVESTILGGWPSPFYIFGTLSLIWCCIWFLVASDCPGTNRWISQEEKDYISGSIGSEHEKLVTPWKEIWTSVPLWAVVVMHMGHTWFFFTMVMELPTFFNDVLQLGTERSALFASLIYVPMLVTSILGGMFADYMIEHKITSVTFIRKLMTAIGHFLPPCFLIASTYSGCNISLAVALILASVGSNGAAKSGYEVNHLDLTRHFPGVLMGISSTIGSMPGFLVPFVVGRLTENQQTIEQWRIIYFISSAVLVVTTLFYLIFASGERQEWDVAARVNYSKSEESSTDNQML